MALLAPWPEVMGFTPNLPEGVPAVATWEKITGEVDRNRKT